MRCAQRVRSLSVSQSKRVVNEFVVSQLAAASSRAVLFRDEEQLAGRSLRATACRQKNSRALGRPPPSPPQASGRSSPGLGLQKHTNRDALFGAKPETAVIKYRSDYGIATEFSVSMML